MGFNGKHQVLHTGVLMSLADDVERLHQGHARVHHGGELTAEDGDVLGDDLFLAGGEECRLFLDRDRLDALPAQIGLYQAGIGATGFPFDFFPFLIGADPDVDMGLFRFLCCDSHRINPL